MDVSDIYLGSVMIHPDFDSPTNPQSWFQLQGVPSGEIKIQVEYVPFRQVSGSGYCLALAFKANLRTDYTFSPYQLSETTVIDGVFRTYEGGRQRYLWQGELPIRWTMGPVWARV